MTDRIPPSLSPDDSQRVQEKTLAVATAVADLVPLVKQVLQLTRSAMLLARVAIIMMFLVIAGLSYNLYRQSQLLDSVRQTSDGQASAALQLTGLVLQFQDQQKDMAAVREDVAGIPRIDVKPADTADPRSKPVAVIRSGKAPPPVSSVSASALPVPAIEIPLDLPKH